MHPTSNRNNRRKQQAHRFSRRTVVGAALGSLGWPLAATACGDGPQPQAKQAVLKRGDRLKVEGKPEEIVERAYRLGYDYEKRYGGCAQCTVAALQDAVPFVPADLGLFRGAGCLDGGATPAGVQNCGAFTGCGMIIGHLCGRTRDGGFVGDGGLCHELIRKVYARFEQAYGSVLCRDVRFEAKKDCPRVVGDAARWTAEVLLEAFAGYKLPALAAPGPKPAGPVESAGPKYTVEPIGWVRKADGKTTIVIDKKYQAALLGVDKLSEIWVMYWFDRNDSPQKRAILQVHPRGDLKNPLRGVFATRSPMRPNLIALSRCKVLSVKENVIEIDEIDAFPDTPVLDLKS